MGCIFKNPENASAGELIDKTELKGFEIGGAQISEKHANFIINTGNATAQNVLDLIEFVQVKVNEKFGVALTTEIKIL